MTRSHKGKPQSAKWRGNWHVPLCLKFGCKNRDRRCHRCVRFSEWEERG